MMLQIPKIARNTPTASPTRMTRLYQSGNRSSNSSSSEAQMTPKIRMTPSVNVNGLTVRVRSSRYGGASIITINRTHE